MKQGFAKHAESIVDNRFDNRQSVCTFPDVLFKPVPVVKRGCLMAEHSIKRGSKIQRQKPYSDFPLTVRADGRLCKKIKGRVHVFGRLDNWQEALERFNREMPFWATGRTPPAVDTGGLTIRVMCNEFLNSKRALLNSGELSQRSFTDYFKTCEKLVKQFGKDRCVDDLRPADFERFRSAMASVYGVVTLKNEINRCRIVFKYASDNRLIDRPVHYGQAFAKPPAKMIRRARNEAGPRMFEADELRTILDALAGNPVQIDGAEVPVKADPALRAMVLLGINGGFGNTDVANLPQSGIDFENGWINFARPKTEIHRRIPLWPETVDALRTIIARRPKPIDQADAGLVFLTRQGRRWVRVQGRATNDGVTTSVDVLSQRFARLLKKVGINGRRNFYALRHGFETIGGESRDQVAVSAIMGHADASMSGAYRERISDERLRAVADTVRDWLWPAD